MTRSGGFLLGVAVAAAAGAQCIPVWQDRGGGPWPDHEVLALTTWDPDGPGAQAAMVVAGGNLFIPSLAVGLWNGSSWLPMGIGTTNGNVQAATTFDADGAGPLLAKPVVGGAFTVIGGVSANRIAWWDGSSWHPFGAGIGGPGQVVDELVAYEGDLIAAGMFTTAGGLPSDGLARWDGAAWHDFSQVMSNGPDALMVRGDYLYAEGRLPDGQYGVRRYRDGAWEVLGGQFQGHEVGGTWALSYFRNNVIAAGEFNAVGLHRIARWNGTDWLPLGQGLNSTVRCLTVWDPDGAGPMEDLLIAGGYFNMAGGQPANGVAAWNGQAWTPLGPGLDARAMALTPWKDELVVGGSFWTAGGLNTPYFALYGCNGPCAPDCNGDGALTLADFGCFTTKFALQDPYADCNADGVRNLSDFGCFTTKFALGCP